MRSSIFTRNIGTKILALILSVALWWVVRQGEVTRATISPVRIVLTNVPDNMEIIGQSTQFVSISARGPGNIIKDIGKDNFQIEFDLSKAKVGTNRIPLIDGFVKTLYLDEKDENKISILEDSLENEIFVVTLKRIEKSVKVQPDIYGEPNSKYAVKEIKIDPAVVIVTGPAVRLEKLNQFKTENIDITNLSENLSRSVRLLAAPSDIKFVTPENGEVTITISLNRVNNKIEKLEPVTDTQ